MKLKFISEQKQEQFSIAMDPAGRFFSSKQEIAQILLRKPILEGTYSFALMLDQDTAFFARDSLGTKKLFYYRDLDNNLLYVANNFLELTDRFDPEQIYSVPKGGFLTLSSKAINRTAPQQFSYREKEFVIDHVKSILGAFFRYLRLSLKRKPLVCLSGGLDSAVIAYFAMKEFGTVDVVTGVLGSKKQSFEQITDNSDFAHAMKISKELNSKFTPVFIDQNEIKKALKDILRVSQDWRDYNVHCAVINYFIAKNIKYRFDTEKYVILTGDFMNEIFADYTSEFYEGVEYYQQANFRQKTRQRFFMNGLDSSDREIGVFNNFGLQCIQPYAFVANYYRCLTDEQLCMRNSKYIFNGQLISNNLLKEVGKSKVRAQVGDKNGGILGHFIRMGVTQDKLIDLFCDSFSLDKNFLRQFIQVGAYKTENL